MAGFLGVYYVCLRHGILLIPCISSMCSDTQLENVGHWIQTMFTRERNWNYCGC